MWQSLAAVGRRTEAKAVRRWSGTGKAAPDARPTARVWPAPVVRRAAARYVRLLHLASPHGTPRRASARLLRTLAEALLRDPCRFDRPALLLLAAGARARRLSAPLRSAMLALHDARVWHR